MRLRFTELALYDKEFSISFEIEGEWGDRQLRSSVARIEHDFPLEFAVTDDLENAYSVIQQSIGMVGARSTCNILLKPSPSNSVRELHVNVGLPTGTEPDSGLSSTASVLLRL